MLGKDWLYITCDFLFQLKYYHEIGQVISCSNHQETALVIGKYIHVYINKYGITKVTVCLCIGSFVYKFGMCQFSEYSDIYKFSLKMECSLHNYVVYSIFFLTSSGTQLP